MSLNVAWFLGFGWPTILLFVACGLAINLWHGPFVWVLYIPLLLVALYMAVRFRLHSMHPWRRAHRQAMARFGKFAEREYDQAKKEGRQYDIAVPCRELACGMFGEQSDAVRLLAADNRKRYYLELAKEFPEVFLKNFASERHDAVLAEIYRDIEASELGPDILIARDIEVRYSRREAAEYLHALMVGEVR